jgi:hypothetical protein
MIATSVRSAAVIDGLVALAAELFDGEKVRVIDGPVRATPSEKNLLFIGWDPNSPIHAVSRREESDLGDRVTEVGEIACYIATAAGSQNMKAARDVAIDLLTRLEQAIREDRDGLDGACDLAEIGPDAGVWQYQTASDGASIGLPFSVRYEAYI